RSTSRTDRAGAFANNHAETFPRDSRESTNGCALGRNSQSARRGEKEKRKERPLPFGHDRVGSRPRDGETRAVPAFDSGRRKHRRERKLRDRDRGRAREQSARDGGDSRCKQKK